MNLRKSASVLALDFLVLPNAPVLALLVSEVLYDTDASDSNGEWIEIFNESASVVNIGGFKIGDEETMGSGEGMYTFPAGQSLEPGLHMILARRATGFMLAHGFQPDFEFIDTDPTVPDMSNYSVWGSGGA